MTKRLLAAPCAVALLTACGSQGAGAPHAGAGGLPQTGGLHAVGSRFAASSTGGKIQHVVYIVQENRSFNNLFMGYPGATTQDFGYGPHGKKIKLHQQTIATNWDISHGVRDFLAAYDGGKLDGWNREGLCCSKHRDFAYAYAPRRETKTYWAMAAQYVLSDMTFQSNLDGSFVAHQYAIAAYANHEADYPNSDWSCFGGTHDTLPTLNQDRTFGPYVPVCEDYATLGDELDAAGLAWRSYTSGLDTDSGLWSPYASVDHIVNGPDWSSDVVSPQAQFISDVANGQLAAVTWISPTFANSDHAGLESKGGPAWVASLVDAVGSSQFWDSTAIFVIWDDWGGWYDPVPPVYADYDGLGFRVPLLAISAYAKTGYVSHVQYESSSVLRFIEDDFGLAQLAASDARAADPAGDFFDFTQTPRPFVPFPSDGPRVAPAGSRKHLPVDGD